MSIVSMPSVSQLIATGVALIFFGALSVASPAIAGTAVVWVIGAILLVAGSTQLIQGFRSKKWAGKAFPLMLGGLTALCGLAVLGHPWLGLSLLTMVIAITFTVEGLWKIYAAFRFRIARGWLGMLISGFLTLILGLLIWRQWPVSGLTAVGVLVGIDLLCTGVSMVFLGVTVRQAKKAASVG